MFMSILLFACSNGKKQKPSTLPNNAEWIGGSDGGVWIAFKKEDEQRNLEFAIYQESGELWVSTNFTGNCKFDKNLSLADQIEAFDGENLIMKENLPDGKNRLLRKKGKE